MFRLVYQDRDNRLAKLKYNELGEDEKENATKIEEECVSNLLDSCKHKVLQLKLWLIIYIYI